MIDLQSRVAFVTGSTRGIGWATARTLAEHGCSVVLHGRSQDVVNERAAELEKLGVRTLGLAGDVTSPDSVKTFYPAIHKAFGRLDVFVNNAGILKDALLGMIGADLVASVLETNLAAPILHLQAASRLMQRNPRGGSIVNLSSIVGRFGNVGQTAYSATKAGIIGLTRSAAKELAAKQIRVNAVAPGFIDTDMIKSIPTARATEIMASVAMKRIGTPQDVANVILFLASDLSAYVTGQVLGVDGGMVL
jgi:3-oxoacyl-[acyl-carrier protein] reductase